MGKLTFVGLGLGAEGISLQGIKEIKEADRFYLEYYTTPHEASLLRELERASGREATVVDRPFVEDGKKILAEAKESIVVLGVPGDPMIATTHGELRVRAIRAGIETSIVHGVTIASAVASSSGLHYYKFSKTVTVTRESVPRLTQVYHTLHKNLLEGSHTLLLLEYDTEQGEGVSPPAAIEGLLRAEENFRRGVLKGETLALVMSRVGTRYPGYAAGPLTELRRGEYGRAPHCIVVPGKLHFTEVEAVSAIFSMDSAAVSDNSAGVTRTAQTLVPKYVAKTKRALDQVRDKLGPEYKPVLENAELYMKDAESFLANGEDELAMLSIGYAEGLLDSMNFSGIAQIDW
jgi:diphthine synthase